MSVDAHRAIPRPEVERNRMDRARRLRERTGAPVLDCLKALNESRWDDARAIEWLRAHALVR